MAQRIDKTVFRGREFRFILKYSDAITDFTVTSTASDGTTDFDATIVKDAANKLWYITWTDSQTTLMTSDKYQYDIKITDGSDNDYQGYYGTFTMKDSIT